MKQPQKLFTAAFSALALSGLVAPGSSYGQSDVLPPPNAIRPQPARVAAPAPAPAVAPAPVLVADATLQQAALEALVTEVVAQQAKLAENQKVIDDKLAVIAENLRIARIYVSRAK